MDKKYSDFLYKIEQHSNLPRNGSVDEMLKGLLYYMRRFIPYSYVELWLLTPDQTIEELNIDKSLSLIAFEGDSFSEQPKITCLERNKSNLWDAIINKKTVVLHNIQGEDISVNYPSISSEKTVSLTIVPLQSSFSSDRDSGNIIGVVNFFFNMKTNIKENEINILCLNITNMIERIKLVHRDRITTHLLSHYSKSLVEQCSQCINILESYGYDDVSIFSYNRRLGKLVLIESTSLVDSNKSWFEATYNIGEGLTGEAALAKRPLVINDLKKTISEYNLAGKFIECNEQHHTSFLAYPILDDNYNLIGIIRCINKKLNNRFIASYSSIDLDLVDRVTSLISQQFQNSKILNINQSLLEKIAHDLKAPVVGIRNIASRIQRNHNRWSSNEIELKANDMINNCNFLLLTINQVEPIHNFKFSYQNIKGPIFINLINQMKSLVNDYNLRSLTHKTLEHLPDKLFVDAQQVKRLLYNLLNNALKYSYENTDVLVYTQEPKDGFFRLTVENYGIGIDPKYEKSVFRPRFRSPEAEKYFEGTGWGLAISQEIAEKHGGLIEFEKLNNPTKITLFLPIYLHHRTPHDSDD